VDSLCDDGVDGGYYAIKGFMYQFDKTILEIFERPDEDIAVEYLQDINSEDYVIQCKYKESQDYTDSKIRKPILQLLQVHKQHPEMEIILYCYFKNRGQEKWKLAIDELDSILRGRKKDHTKDFFDADKQSFLGKLTVEFSCEYSIQEGDVIEKIQQELNCNGEVALIYHGLFRNELFKKAINKDTQLRITNLPSLRKLTKDINGTIFPVAYEDFLGVDEYIKFVKKQYFTFPSGNVNAFERLFIVELDNTINTTDILTLVLGISRKYYKAYRGIIKSPPPYICLVGNNELQIEAKRKLVDQNITFTDGTCFNGDIFRMDKLSQKASVENGLSLRLLSEHYLPELSKSNDFDEVYCLMCSDKKYYDTYKEVANINKRNCNYIQVSSFNAIIKFFE
jgi:hypothetical protein